MFELFYMGGTLFMSILTIIFIAMVATTIINFLSLQKDHSNSEVVYRKLAYTKQIGLFALVVGILGQLIGLFEAFKYIEQAGNVSPEMMAGGIKVSMITTLYGFLIFIISYLIWFGLSYRFK